MHTENLFDESCPNCGARISSPELTACPRCTFALRPVDHFRDDSLDRGDAGSADRADAAASQEPAMPLDHATDATNDDQDSGHHHDHDRLDPDHEPIDLVADEEPAGGVAAAPLERGDGTNEPSVAAPTAVGLGATAKAGKPHMISTAGTAGGVRIAGAVAAVCLLLLIVGHLWGLSGFFPRQDGLFRDANGEFAAETVRWTDRLVDLVRLLVQRAVVWAAAIAALFGFATWCRIEVKNWSVASARMAAIAIATALIAAIALQNRVLEVAAEALLQCALFVGLVVLWFRMSFIDALRILGLTALGFVLVHVAALLVVWATGTRLF